MTATVFGYKRVSTSRQNFKSQLQGLNIEQLFTDKCSSTKPNRPGIKSLISKAKEGDEVYINSVDRLSRNEKEVEDLLTKLTSKGAIVHFVREGMEVTKRSLPGQLPTLKMIAAFYEKESKMTGIRTKEGIKAAQLSPKRKQGMRIPRAMKNALCKEEHESLSNRALAQKLGVSPSSAWKYRKVLEKEKQPDTQMQLAALFFKFILEALG